MSKSPAVATLVAAVAALVSSVTLGGCKGESKPKDTPATLAKLEDCTAQLAKLADKDKLIASYEGEIARLKLAGESAGTYTFVMEGDVWTKKSKPSGGAGPALDDKAADALAHEFIALVGRSRPPIQHCYEQALKKNSGLQARTVTLKVEATFGGTGTFSKASFKPDLGDAFDTCMRGVAGKWKLTGAGAAATFQATVTLSPS